MIELKIKDYCENCEFFEPNVNKVSADIIDLFCVKTICNTTITCQNENMCKCIFDYLKEEHNKSIKGEQK